MIIIVIKHILIKKHWLTNHTPGEYSHQGLAASSVTIINTVCDTGQ